MRPSSSSKDNISSIQSMLNGLSTFNPSILWSITRPTSLTKGHMLCLEGISYFLIWKLKCLGLSVWWECMSMIKISRTSSTSALDMPMGCSIENKAFYLTKLGFAFQGMGLESSWFKNSMGLGQTTLKKPILWLRITTVAWRCLRMLNTLPRGAPYANFSSTIHFLKYFIPPSHT